MTDILDQLNAYEGDNIWRDVIDPLGDAIAVTFANRTCTEDCYRLVGEDGTTYVYDLDRQKWVVR